MLISNDDAGEDEYGCLSTKGKSENLLIYIISRVLALVELIGEVVSVSRPLATLERNG